MDFLLCCCLCSLKTGLKSHAAATVEALLGIDCPYLADTLSGKGWVLQSALTFRDRSQGIYINDTWTKSGVLYILHSCREIGQNACVHVNFSSSFPHPPSLGEDVLYTGNSIRSGFSTVLLPLFAENWLQEPCSSNSGSASRNRLPLPRRYSF